MLHAYRFPADPLSSPPLRGEPEARSTVPTSSPAAPEPVLASKPRSIAVFRALQLGDMLCAVPALRALRRAAPQARITLIGLPWAADFARRFAAYVDDFIAFPGLPGLPEREPDPAAWPAFVEAARQRQFDLAIQMHGDGSRTNAVVRSLGAPTQAGFAPAGDGRAFLSYPDDGPEPRRLLRLTDFLGAPSSDESLEFPLLESDAPAWQGHAAVQALLRDPKANYLCVHPGARDPARRWPVQHFAAVADALAASTGLQVVITGSGEEAGLARELAAAMHAPAIEAAAAVPIGALAALIRGARLLISNDTGPSHVAAGLKVPSVVIFRASDMARWAPLDAALHRAVWDPQGVRVTDVCNEALSLLLR